MNNLENELRETRDIRRKRAEIMRRLWADENGKKYTLESIAEIYGCTKGFVHQEIRWLEKQEEA